MKTILKSKIKLIRKTSYICNETISRPPQSHETIPLRKDAFLGKYKQNIFFHCRYEAITAKFTLELVNVNAARNIQPATRQAALN
jgi:hypothetical protein